MFRVAGGGTGGGGGGASSFATLSDANNADIPTINTAVGAILNTVNANSSSITSLLANQVNDLNVPTGWNATTNTPALVSSTAGANNCYIVTVAGTTTLDGISSWALNDMVIFNAGGVATWTKIPGGGFVGIYATAAALQTAYPAASYAGSTASVGSATPYTFYVSDGNSWGTYAPGVPQNSKSAAYTTVLADANGHILHPAADTTARTFTIDSNANVAYAIGTTLTFVNQNAGGVLTIAITTDTMRLAGAGTTGSRTLAANGIATALKITATEWIINGTGLT